MSRQVKNTKSATNSQGPVPYGKTFNSPDLKLCLSPIVSGSIEFMASKLRRFGVMMYRYDDGILTRFPGRVRGNGAYAYAMRSRVETINNHFLGAYTCDVINHQTNTVFVTLTAPSIEGYNATVSNWKRLSGARDKLFVNLRKRGVRSYVYAVESNGTGGYHVHAALIFDRSFTFWTDKGGKWRNDEIRDLVKWYWGSIGWKLDLETGKKIRVSVPHGHIDVQGCVNKDIVQYITKEIFKASSCEKSIQAIEKGNKLILGYLEYQGAIDKGSVSQSAKIANAEIKKILAFGLAGAARIRQWGVSRDIKINEPEEETIDNMTAEEIAEDRDGDILRLDSLNVLMHSSKSDIDDIIGAKSVSLVASRAELVTYLGYCPPPFYGTVEKGSQEYEKILSYMIKYTKYGQDMIINTEKPSPRLYRREDDIRAMQRFHDIEFDQFAAKCTQIKELDEISFI